MIKIILIVSGLLMVYKSTAIAKIAPDFPELMNYPLSYPFLTIGVLEKLQRYRGFVGVVDLSSPESGGLLRWEKGSSQHIKGRAIDTKWPIGVSKREAYNAAIKAGFTGIGVYSWGLHLDDRGSREEGNPATWGRIYTKAGFEDVSAEEVLRRVEA